MDIDFFQCKKIKALKTFKKQSYTAPVRGLSKSLITPPKNSNTSFISLIVITLLFSILSFLKNNTKKLSTDINRSQATRSLAVR